MSVWVVLAALLVGCATTQKPGGEYFSHWPAGTSPAEIGKRVAENFATRKFDFETNPKRKSVIYPEVCAWYGSLTVAHLTGDRNLQDQLVHKFDYLLTPEGASRISTNAHVDYRVFGIVPLEIFMLTKDKKYLEIGQSLADEQWKSTTDDGITVEARYWIDDMFMITAVQVQAFRATGLRRAEVATATQAGNAKYLDRAATTMVAYLDKLQQPNGLFYHGMDSPFFWGRGNGWVAAGMTELLGSLPENHPQRARVMASYRTMMDALLKYQGEDGLWRQLIDHPESWPETSSTAMFTFAMVTGVKSGWLDAKTFGPAARKAWLGLMTHLDKDANVDDVCAGTPKGDNLEHYLNRPRKVGDLHGQAPILWTAAALLR